MPSHMMLFPRVGAIVGALVLIWSVEGAEYFVSVHGRDTWSGTLPEPNAGMTDGPFATLIRARDQIRGDRGAGRPELPATVHVRAGLYRLPATFTLTSTDGGTAKAPVVYRAYRDEAPVLTGGVPVTGFALHTDGVLKADLAAQGLAGVRLRQLYCGSKRQVLARYPNVDPANPVTGGWAYVAQQPEGTAADRRVLRYRQEDARQWRNPEQGSVFIFPSHEWWNNIVPIESVDPVRRLVTVAANCSYEIKPEDRYFVMGLLEELDAPGEWCVDAAHETLYFRPPEPGAAAPVTVPVVQTLLEIDGAKHITVRGLTLECCAGTAVMVTDSTDCLIAGCTIRDVGGYSGSGVSLSGGTRSGVVGCDIHDVGCTGVVLSGGDQRTLTPAANYAENNHITRTGVDYKQGVGISVSGVGNRVSRNTIHDVPRWCVRFGGNNNVIEYNHLFRASLETSDTGAIYGGSLNWLSAHGTMIRHNYIHDIVGCGRRNGEWRAPFFAWGIYLDWTAMGVTVRGNIITRCPRAGIMVHDGRFNTIEDNIVVDCGRGRHDPASQIELVGWHDKHFYWDRGLGFGWVRQYESVADQPAWHGEGNTLRHPHRSALPDGRTMHGNTVRRNILVSRDGRAQAFRFRNVSVEHNSSDHNVIWAGGRPVKTGRLELGGEPGPNLVRNPGFEDDAPGERPSQWSCRIPSPECDASVDGTVRHGGVHSLRLTGVASPANAGKPPWLRHMAASCKYIRDVVPGRAYRAAVWLKAREAGTRVRLEALSFRHKAYDVRFSRVSAVGTEWAENHVAFRFPQEGDGNYHAGMDETFYIRITLCQDAGTLWIDDAELREGRMLDEWQAWQNAGWDRHSIVADPLFIDPDRDDFRPKAESPAWELGFEPIAVEKLGCYRDPLRASWPIKCDTVHPASGQHQPGE